MKEFLDCAIDCNLFPVAVVPLKNLAAKVYRKEKIPPGRRTTVIFCSDKVIRRLNAKYRKIDRPTDVLSFPFDEPDFLGEIYISLARVCVQARRYGNSNPEELARLFLHGLLHLAGYDHHALKERLEMEAKERLYLSK